MEKHNMEEARAREINCFKCKYFFITWDPSFPNGCKIFGFKSKQTPSQVVRNTTGEPCIAHEKK